MTEAKNPNVKYLEITIIYYSNESLWFSTPAKGLVVSAAYLERKSLLSYTACFYIIILYILI